MCAAEGHAVGDAPREVAAAGDSHNFFADRRRSGRGRTSDSTSFRTAAWPGCASTATCRWTGRGGPRGGRAVDLACDHEWRPRLGASDMHFGAKDNMIMPGRAANMGDGWETRRRRGPGHDWAIVRLGTTGHRLESRDRHEPLQGQLSGQRVPRGLPHCRGHLGDSRLGVVVGHSAADEASRRTIGICSPASCECGRRRFPRPAQHLSGRRHQPSARSWNPGVGLTRPTQAQARRAAARAAADRAVGRCVWLRVGPSAVGDALLGSGARGLV